MSDPTEPLNIPPKPPLPAPATEPAAPEPPVTEPFAVEAPAVEPEATTLPLPVPPAAAQPGYPPTAAYTQPGYTQPGYAQPPVPPAAAQAAAPPRKRRRWKAPVITLGILVVLAVVVGVGWFAGNAWAKQTVIDRVQQETRSALGVPSDHPVDVTVAEPVLPQLIGGSLSTLTVQVPDAPLGGTTGDVTMKATDVPVRGDGTARSVTASVSLKPDAISKLAGSLGRTIPGSLHIVGDDVAVSLDPSQFLSGVSFTLTLRPSAKDGELVLTPVAFDVGGASMSADVIRQRFGSLADGILAPRSFCVATAFPKGMTMTSIQVGKDAVVTAFDVDPRIMTDATLQKPGTCS